MATHDMYKLIINVRTRLDDLTYEDLEFEDEHIQQHIQNNLDSYGFEVPLTSGRDAQLICVETLIDIIMSIKIWADGESYSYKNDAIQVTRGLLSKHYQDTINLLKEERNELIMLDGGFA